MTNYEMHREELEKILLENGVCDFGVEGNTVQDCNDINCNCCIFSNVENCNNARAEWLKAEYEEPVTAETLYSSFCKFCDSNHICTDCELHTGSAICKFAWILKNYYLTKKEDKQNDKL